MAKKKSISAARAGKNMVTVSTGGEATTFLDQPAENNVHAGEEVVVADDPSAIPSTSVDNEAAADARRESNLEPNKSTISYAETWYSLEPGPFH
jgi:hypothetical protein